MSLFVRSIRHHHHSSMQAFRQAYGHSLGRRCCIAIAAGADNAESMGLARLPLLPRGETLSQQTLFHLPTLAFENSIIGFIPTTRTTTATSSSPSSLMASVGETLVDSLQSLLGDISTWFIKRTYQPSIIRKRRKHGFRRRKESVGGRRVLKRRMAKGRIRLGGC